MAKDIENRDEIDFSQTENLVKERTEFDRLYVLISVFIAFSLFLTMHAVYSIYDSWTDDSIPLTICPRSFDLDAPVLMKSIQENDQAYVQDRWIRGFIRRFVLNSYPRVPEDAEKFFQFAHDHSEGELQRKYRSFLNSMNEIRTALESRNISFYPKNSSEIRIRGSGNPGQWVIEIEGYMVKDLGAGQERAPLTLRYVIEKRKPTRTNPDGLVVVDAKMDLIADYVSGRQYGTPPKEGQ